jgi:diacylglycerol kinase (ATP)
MNKFLRGFYFAFQGLSYAFRTQLNFKVEVFAAMIVLALSYYLELQVSEWLWVCLAITLVLLTELANTAIETLVDLISPEHNPRAGIIKDLAAAVVLLSALFALAVGLFVLLPRIIHAA